jgi:hypothetical protein
MQTYGDQRGGWRYEEARTAVRRVKARRRTIRDGGSGRLEVEGKCASEVIFRYWVSFAWYSFSSYSRFALIMTNPGMAAVLKIFLATIYTNLATSIMNDEGIEQLDGMLASPVGDKLILRFDRP